MKPHPRMALLGAMAAAMTLGGVVSPPPTIADPGPRDEASRAHVTVVESVVPMTSELASATDTTSVAFDEVVRLVPQLVEEYSSNFAGTEIRSTQEILTVYLVDRDGAGAVEFGRLMERLGEKYVEVVEVPASYDTLKDAQGRIVKGEFGFVPVLAYSDPENGKIRLQLQDNAYSWLSEASAEAEMIGDPAVLVSGDELLTSTASGNAAALKSIDMAAVAESLAVSLDVAIEPALVFRANAGPRNASAAPFAAGAKINNYAGTETCSLGMPIYVKGKRTVATAAHCTPMKPPTVNWNKWTTSAVSGNLVGTQLYSPFHTGNTLAGDWQLLSNGSVYALEMYNGGPYGSSTADLTGGDFTVRPKGASLVSSGGQTGLKSGYSVTLTNVSGSVCAGVNCYPTNHNTVATFGVNPNCYGWQDGDSGGLVAYLDTVRPGHYWGYGLASGSAPRAGGGCFYLVAQLSAIRAWDPGATVIH